jgi:hypothetical protein
MVRPRSALSDALTDGTDLEREIRHGTFGDLEDHALADGTPESLLLSGDDVLAWRQKRKLIITVVAGERGRDGAGGNGFGFHLGSGNQSSRRIGDAAGKRGTEFLCGQRKAQGNCEE